MMHGWGYGMRGFFGGGMLMMGIFWIAIIAIVIYFLRNSNKSTNRVETYRRDVKEDPLEIAKKRYAKGEISKEEFQEIKEEIKS
ncbi:SHOCT domain-containing protein [Orenia marismortui]|uniref:SHOCT domain-containing protein n=1 Tax=Orenia marismortui TaxID=46469 RepID=UPI0003771DD6|nr:SHOCT domain-containing protein [Orenia marismortui]